MDDIKGFWSYVHSDNDAEGGRIVDLAHDIVNQYKALTTDNVKLLFLDQDNINLGEDWKEVIDANLASVGFFIPVITPRYFASASCRNELISFAQEAESLGLKELIIPVLYIDFDELHQEDPDDGAIALVNRFQWFDWTGIRFHSRKSSIYRNAVWNIAQRLADANLAVEHSVDSQPKDDNEDDSLPGSLDFLAATETVLPESSKTLGLLSTEVMKVGDLMANSKAKINNNAKLGRGAAANLDTVKSLAGNLTEPALQIEKLGQQYTKQIHEVDGGIRILIESLRTDVKENPEKEKSSEQFFESLNNMYDSTEKCISILKSFLESLSSLEATSRDLRKPLKTIRKGLILFMEGADVIREWHNLAEKKSAE